MKMGTIKVQAHILTDKPNEYSVIAEDGDTVIVLMYAIDQAHAFTVADNLKLNIDNGNAWR